MFRLYYSLLTLIAVVGLVSSALLQPWGLIFIGISLLSLLGLKDVPANPPHVAIPTAWGKRLNKMFGEGLKLIANFFPFYLDFIPISVTYRNLDFTFEGIRCRLKIEDGNSSQTNDPKDIKSGGAVTATVTLTIEPDYRSGDPTRLHQYLNAGEAEGVKNILRDMLAEALRHEGTRRHFEYMMFGKDRLTAILITALTGIFIPEAKRDDEDNVICDARGKIILIDSSYIKPDDADPLEIEHFLETALINGVSDIHSLGITIRRLNVVKVVPEGKLLDDAERAAREVQQRTTEVYDFTTEGKLVQIYLDEAKRRDKDMTIEEAYRMVRINRNRSTEILINPHQKQGSLLDPLIAAVVLASGRDKERSNP